MASSPFARSLLDPESVAIVGASEDQRLMSGAPVANLLRHGWRGRIYPVNPNRSTIQGLRAYRTLDDLPEVPNSVVIATRAEIVPSIVERASALGVGTVSVVAGGLRDEKDGSRESATTETLRGVIGSSGMRMLGPNTTGVVNLFNGYVPRAVLNHPEPEALRSGPIGLVSQSGALSNSAFARAQAAEVGIGITIATGDQLDVDVWEAASVLLDDERLGTIAVIVEAASRLSGLIALLRSAHAVGKRVVVLPLGRTAAGRRVVDTHTGSLSSDMAVVSAIVRDGGGIEVASLDGLWQSAALSQAWATETKPPRLGVVSISGGEAALLTDRLASGGVDLPAPAPEFSGWVQDNFGFAQAGNPFDPTGELLRFPDKLGLVLDAFASMNGYRPVLICSPVFGAAHSERLFPAIASFLANHSTRSAVSALSAGAFTETGLRILRSSGAVVFDDSLEMADAVAAWADYRLRLDAAVPGTFFADVLAASSDPAAATDEPSYWEARRLLADAGFPFADACVIERATDAEEWMERIPAPYVIKANTPSGMHKAGPGLIALGVQKDSLAEAISSIEARAARSRTPHDGFVVERMVQPGLEILIGARLVESVPVLVVGLGGLLAEALQDTAVAVGPISAARAAFVLGSTKTGRLIAERSADSSRLISSLIATFSTWFLGSGYDSAEVNPVVLDLSTGSICAVDARVVPVNRPHSEVYQ